MWLPQPTEKSNSSAQFSYVEARLLPAIRHGYCLFNGITQRRSNVRFGQVHGPQSAPPVDVLIIYLGAEEDDRKLFAPWLRSEIVGAVETDDVGQDHVEHGHFRGPVRSD